MKSPGAEKKVETSRKPVTDPGAAAEKKNKGIQADMVPPNVEEGKRQGRWIQTWKRCPVKKDAKGVGTGQVPDWVNFT